MVPAKPSLLTVLPQFNCTIYYLYTTLEKDLETLLYYSSRFFFNDMNIYKKYRKINIALID